MAQPRREGTATWERSISSRRSRGRASGGLRQETPKKRRGRRRAIGERSNCSVHRKLVVDTEGAEDLIGPQAGDLLVHLALDGAVECHVSVVDDDADRIDRIGGVAPEHRVAIDSADHANAQVVVKY